MLGLTEREWMDSVCNSKVMMEYGIRCNWLYDVPGNLAVQCIQRVVVWMGRYQVLPLSDSSR